MKCGRDVEEFRVEAKLSFTALLSREQVDADRVIEEQIRGMLTPEISGLFRKQGIGNEQRLDLTSLSLWCGLQYPMEPSNLCLFFVSAKHAHDTRVATPASSQLECSQIYQLVG